MFCDNCGRKIPVGSHFCPYCRHVIGGPMNPNRVLIKTNPQPRYPYKRHHNRALAFCVGAIVVIAVACLAAFGMKKYRQYQQHEYYARNYINLNDDGGKYGYHTDVSHYKFWQEPHYIIVKHNIRAYDISDKNVAEVQDYSIGSKILKKGTVVKAQFTPTVPGGFGIEGKGFRRNRKKDSFWMVNPASINSKPTRMAKESNDNDWIKAVKK